MSRRQKKFKQAVYCYKKAIRLCFDESKKVLSPSTQAIVFELATCYITLEDYTRATRWLELLHRYFPSIIYNLVTLYENKNTDAFVVLDESFLNRELAKCYYQQNRIDDVLTLLEQTVAVKQLTNVMLPEDEATNYVVCDEIHTDESNQTYKNVYDVHTVNMLAQIYIELAHYTQCDDLLSKVLKSFPNPPFQLFARLAISHLYLGKVITYVS